MRITREMCACARGAEVHVPLALLRIVCDENGATRTRCGSVAVAKARAMRDGL